MDPSARLALAILGFLLAAPASVPATAHPTDAVYPSNQVNVVADGGVVTVSWSNAAFACSSVSTLDAVTPDLVVDVSCIPPATLPPTHNGCQSAATYVAGFGVQVDGQLVIGPGGSDTGIPIPSVSVGVAPAVVAGFIEATGGCDGYRSHTSAVAPSASWDHVAAYSDLTVQTCTVHVSGPLVFSDWGGFCPIG